MHRGDSKICRPTADRHSTCSVLNKTAPPVHGADGTKSIRTRLNPAKPYQAAKNQTDSRCQKAMVGRVIAAWRTPPSLLSGWGCRDRRLSRGRRTFLLRQTHATHQVQVAWIGAKAIKKVLGFYVFQACRALFVCLLQPIERLVAIAHKRVVCRYLIGRDVFRSRLILQ